MKQITSKFSLLAVIGATAVLAVITPSCSKSHSGGGGPTPLGGYVSSDSVASANLVAYWPFDGDPNDHKGGITGTAVGVSYVAGVRGQAYQGATAAYIAGTPSAALKSLGSYSLSVWYFQPAQPTGTPNTPQALFMMANATTDPELILENEHYAPVSGDSVRLHAGFFDPGLAQWNGWIMETFDTAAIGKWVHFVMTYDGGSSTYIVYQNGRPMNNSSAFGTSTSTMLTAGPANASPASPPVGPLNFSSNPPTNLTIGTWTVGTFGVSNSLGANGCFLGKLDELRIYNKALTQNEVAGLFLNGQAGR